MLFDINTIQDYANIYHVSCDTIFKICDEVMKDNDRCCHPDG